MQISLVCVPLGPSAIELDQIVVLFLGFCSVWCYGWGWLDFVVVACLLLRNFHTLHTALLHIVTVTFLVAVKYLIRSNLREQELIHTYNSKEYILSWRETHSGRSRASGPQCMGSQEVKRDRMGPWIKILRARPRSSLLPTKLYLAKLSQPSKTSLLAGNQVYKHMSLQRTL